MLLLPVKFSPIILFQSLSSWFFLTNRVKMLTPALITCLCCFTSSEGLPPWKDDLRIGNPLKLVVEPCSWSQGRRPIVELSLSLFCLLGGNLPSKWCGRQLNLGGKSVGSDGVRLRDSRSPDRTTSSFASIRSKSENLSLVN